jgi:ELWxxDGT repeat protein
MAAENLANIRGTLFLSGDDTHTLNNRLWKSDGTTEGTVPVCDDCGSPNWLTPVPDGLFLAADSSFQNTFQGVELVKSNGTASGNVLMDIVPGPKSSSPADLTRAGEMLFFTADDGVHGRELWVTRLGDTLAVANPGFEWSFVYGWRFSGQRPSLSTDSHSGFYAVEFGATFLSTKGMAALYQDLPVVASADYRVSVWKKTLYADKSSFVVASFLRGDGSPIASYPFGHGPADRYALVQSQWLKAPTGAAKLRVALWRRPSGPRDFGRTLFDDVSVREQFQN